MVSGFAGGETGFFGNYLVFRGSDAHAWVEVWTGFAKGWVPFDPTPAAGRPQAEALSWQKRVTNLSDGVEFLFDRYILNFDQNDQLDALRLFRDALEKAFALFQAISTAVTMLPGKPIVVVAFAIALVLSFFAAPVKTKERLTRLTTRFRIRGLPPTAAAYRRLQRLLTKAGARLTPASAPGETLLAAKRFGADAEGVAREIVAAYVSVSFGGTRAETGQRAKLARLLKRARGAMRKRRS